MRMAYIKPTRYKHSSSGYRTFECGYITKMDADNLRVLEKEVISESGTDHIFTDYMALVDPSKQVGINMDLTLDGYIRIWGNTRRDVAWSHDVALSSMELVNESASNVNDHLCLPDNYGGTSVPLFRPLTPPLKKIRGDL